VDKTLDGGRLPGNVSICDFDDAAAAAAAAAGTLHDEMWSSPAALYERYDEPWRRYLRPADRFVGVKRASCRVKTLVKLVSELTRRFTPCSSVRPSASFYCAILSPKLHHFDLPATRRSVQTPSDVYLKRISSSSSSFY